MEKRYHIPGREPCPYLPPAAQVIIPRDVAELRKQGGLEAYLAALNCAQSLWLQGLPAQSLLQLNHAMAHDLGQKETPWPMPYQALLWLLSRRHEEGFLGNPVRHFQHLASRMSGSHTELRVARAWVCFHLSESVLPAVDFPRDIRQIDREALQIPEIEESLERLPAGEERELAQRLLC